MVRNAQGLVPPSEVLGASGIDNPSPSDELRKFLDLSEDQLSQMEAG